MMFRIKESGEIKELTITGTNGIEWTSDLLGNHDALNYNRETEEYEMTTEDFDWWSEYIENHKTDKKEISELAEELNIKESEIYDRINDHITNDLGDEHNIKQYVMEQIREEYK